MSMGCDAVELLLRCPNIRHSSKFTVCQLKGYFCAIDTGSGWWKPKTGRDTFQLISWQHASVRLLPSRSSKNAGIYQSSTRYFQERRDRKRVYDSSVIILRQRNIKWSRQTSLIHRGTFRDCQGWNQGKLIIGLLCLPYGTPQEYCNELQNVLTPLESTGIISKPQPRFILRITISYNNTSGVYRILKIAQ